MADLRRLSAYAGTTKSQFACFSNFMWVFGKQSDGTPAKLARGSQPNYSRHDRPHSLTKENVQFLTDNKIACLISTNSCHLSEDSKRMLGNVGIAYFQFETKDFDTPTHVQLVKACGLIERFSSQGAALVYCGYGEGRTGTIVASWAMSRYLGPQGANLEELCTPDRLRSDFGVERAAQVNAIRKVAGLSELAPGVTTMKPGLSGGAMSSFGDVFMPGGPPSSAGSSLPNFANFGAGGGKWVPPPPIQVGAPGSAGFADDDNYHMGDFAKFSSGT